MLVATLLILGPGCADNDVAPPGELPAVTDLWIEPNSTVAVWTAPEGRDVSCELRYSLGPITEETWRFALPIPISEAAAAAAPSYRVGVPGCYREVTYYFAVRAHDRSGRLSAVSNCPSARGGTAWPDRGQWQPVFESGLGPDGPIHAMVEYRGDLVVAGEFLTLGGVSAQRIALLDESGWHPLGPGLNGTVHDLAVRGDDLFAAGRFDQAGDLATRHVARWDGAAWHAIGAGLEKAPYKIAVHDGLVVAGYWEVEGIFAAWDGAAWEWMPLAFPAAAGGGNCVCLLSTRDGLLAGGEFGSDDQWSTLLRWDGTAWSDFPSKQPPFIVAGLAEVHDELVASLCYWIEGYPKPTPVNLRWNGVDWAPLAVTAGPDSLGSERRGPFRSPWPLSTQPMIRSPSKKAGGCWTCITSPLSAYEPEPIGRPCRARPRRPRISSIVCSNQRSRSAGVKRSPMRACSAWWELKPSAGARVRGPSSGCSVRVIAARLGFGPGIGPD